MNEEQTPIRTESPEAKKETQSQKPRNKWKSIKTWLAILSAVLLSFIVIGNKKEFIPIGEKLVLFLMAYGGLNVWQKKIFEGKENK